MAKTTITFQIENKVKEVLQRRAKRELISLNDLISDILRRSVLSYKGPFSSRDKVDDAFISYFTRKSKAVKKKK